MSKFKDISLYEFFSFSGIKPDNSGSLIYAHVPDSGEHINIQEIPGSYKKICNSNMITLGLRTNGTISGFWTAGIRSNKQDAEFGGLIDNIPSGIFVDVYVDDAIAFALRSDGTIVAWANNNGADLVSYNKDEYDKLTNTTSKFKKIFYNLNRIIYGIKNDGSLEIINRAYFANSKLDSVPEGNNFIDICGTNDTALALRSNGEIEMWGDDNNNEILDKPSGTFKYITSSNKGYAAIRTDNSMVVWGNDVISSEYYPRDNNYKQIQLTKNFGVAVTLDDELIKWGSPNYSTENLFNTIPGTVYISPPKNKFVDVSITSNHKAAVRDDGLIMSWGKEVHNSIATTPTDKDFTQIASPQTSFIALRKDGSLYHWGGEYGNLHSVPKGNDFIQVSCGDSYCAAALRSNGFIEVWGIDGGSSESHFINDAPTSGGFIKVQVSSYSGMGLKSDGSLVYWGENAGTEHDVTPTDKDFVDISMNYSGMLGLKSDGSLLAVSYFGDEESGISTDLPEGNNFTAVSVYGRSNALALTDEGGIVAWGSKTSLTTKNAPVDKGYSHIFAGESINIALKEDGTMVVWGYNGDNMYVDDAPVYGEYIPINSPPIIQLDESIEIDNPSHILIGSKDPNGDMYKISWRLSRSIDDLTVLEDSNDMSYIHSIIRIDLSPGVTLPVKDASHNEFILSVVAEDEHGNISTAESVITIVNSDPVLNIVGDYRSVLMSIVNTDLDTIKVKVYSNLDTDNEKEIYSNTIQYYNKSDIEDIERESGPIEFKYGDDGVIEDILYNYRPGDVVVGEDNIISVIVSDTIWGYTRKDITVMGEHLGLMFYNEDGTLYSDSIGDILNYMDFGNIRSDRELDSFIVLMRNTTNSKITDIQIYQEYQSRSNIIIEFSIDNIEWVDILNEIDLESDDEMDILIRARLVSNNRVPDGITTINISGNMNN